MIEALASVPLFTGLTAAELGPLAAMTVARNYPRNRLVVREGERADTLYFVLSGRIKVFVSDGSGREIALCTQGPGSWFGDMMLDDGVRSASVMTLEASRLASLSRDAFRAFLKRHPDAALALIRNLIHRTREMNERLRDMALLDARGRVAKLLLSLAREANGRLIVEERLTQQEIGERVGASREMVNRILQDLKADGCLRREGRRIVMLRTPSRP